MKKEANSIVKLIFYGICVLFFIYQAGYALGKFVGNYENEVYPSTNNNPSAKK